MCVCVCVCARVCVRARTRMCMRACRIVAVTVQKNCTFSLSFCYLLYTCCLTPSPLTTALFTPPPIPPHHSTLHSSTPSPLTTAFFTPHHPPSPQHSSFLHIIPPHHSTLHSSTGDKFLLRWYRGYLISVSYGGRGGGARSSSIASGKGGVRETMTLSIYDIQNQFVGE